jgi:hypothetical protein
MAVLALFFAACGDDDISVAIPEGATFCSIFDGEYREALENAVPVGDDAFGEATSEIVAWAEVLADLAPAEIADEAQDNLRYHEAQAAVESAAEFIPGSNAMHAWANERC